MRVHGACSVFSATTSSKVEGAGDSAPRADGVARRVHRLRTRPAGAEDIGCGRPVVEVPDRDADSEATDTAGPVAEAPGRDADSGMSDAIGPVAEVPDRGADSGVSDVAGPVARILGGDVDSEGFERALGPRPFEFPRDHGSHGRFRTEWWYFTGHLVTPARRRFGFQLLTFFRFALAPFDDAAPLALGGRDVYMGHFAVTDVETGGFHAFERFARGAVGLAGARATPFRVWVEGWEAASAGGAFPAVAPARRARRGRPGRRAVSGKPWVAQGDRGFSVKGGRPGNAS